MVQPKDRETTISFRWQNPTAGRFSRERRRRPACHSGQSRRPRSRIYGWGAKFQLSLEWRHRL